mmetsp:Transcript_43103/g.104320  ORF Transcript_43103/g.104320 Transcript_43103/m.104320 type:complete len:219 (+) Transcript_43103:94-750(+)|eukprot:CAMPEP_0113630680 /NCGR_PEP_ID=MMETSP0017_2-20120614/15942_1 /TAXON_ID=2856 /ORGANISM="Cylindrotheca closterium" /LENGTH=218 /DNA_ID=CAMNT_0000541157 /DNA_START=67 /DNA_END=723 /DNA_ORIENTATION=- /assembly_acc=CAM_ASM_000147
MKAPNHEIIAVATLEGSPTYVVDLPLEVPPEMLGVTLSGSPPTIAQVDLKSPLQGKVQIGHYIHAVKLVNMEISNLVNCNHLTEVLRVNTNYPRQLVISPSISYIDPMVGKRANHPFFKYQLPASAQVGFAIKGFPPIISSVTDAMQGRLFPGQTVEALHIPGRPLMNLQAGGFTSTNVYTALSETSGVQGRQLVVRDGHKKQKQVGSNAALDDCIIS